jgi:hypothetical protein
MARNEDDFRIRPGKVRDRGGGQIAERRIGAARGRPSSFVGEVYRAIRRAGGNPNRDPSSGKGGGRFNARGRGAATALNLKDRSAWSRDGNGARTRARRVAVKARVVKLNPQRAAPRGRQFVSAKAVDAHLRYLERDGVTKDGEKGQVYSAERTWMTAALSWTGVGMTGINSASSSHPRTARSYPICALPRAA